MHFPLKYPAIPADEVCMARKMTVIIENKREELSVLTQLLQVFLQPYEMPASTLYALELSLEEILVNIVSYAYEDDTGHDIHFAVEVENDTIAMTFVDDGLPFNPLALKTGDPVPPLTERGPGGLGINMVRHMRDIMEYQRKDDSNILRIWFQRNTRFPDRPDAADPWAARSESDLPEDGD